jgi:hypothetical protein
VNSLAGPSLCRFVPLSIEVCVAGADILANECGGRRQAVLTQSRRDAEYYGAVKIFSAAPLGKPRSRDSKDDPYLAFALGATASLIVSRDQDLLVLGKPFGVEIITPRQMLTRLVGSRPLD